MVFRSVLLSQLCHCCFDSLWLPSLIGTRSLKDVKMYLPHSWINDCAFPSGVGSYQGGREESQFVLTYLLLPWQGTVKDKRTILYCCHATWHPSLALINLERKLLTHCYFTKSSSCLWQIAKESLPAAVPVPSISARTVMFEDRAELCEVHQAVRTNQMQHLRNSFC